MNKKILIAIFSITVSLFIIQQYYKTKKELNLSTTKSEENIDHIKRKSLDDIYQDLQKISITEEKHMQLWKSEIKKQCILDELVFSHIEDNFLQNLIFGFSKKNIHILEGLIDNYSTFIDFTIDLTTKKNEKKTTSHTQKRVTKEILLHKLLLYAKSFKKIESMSIDVSSYDIPKEKRLKNGEVKELNFDAIFVIRGTSEDKNYIDKLKVKLGLKKNFGFWQLNDFLIKDIERKTQKDLKNFVLLKTKNHQELSKHQHIDSKHFYLSTDFNSDNYTDIIIAKEKKLYFFKNSQKNNFDLEKQSELDCNASLIKEFDYNFDQEKDLIILCKKNDQYILTTLTKKDNFFDFKNNQVITIKINPNNNNVEYMKLIKTSNKESIIKLLAHNKNKKSKKNLYTLSVNKNFQQTKEIKKHLLNNFNFSKSIQEHNDFISSLQMKDIFDNEKKYLSKEDNFHLIKNQIKTSSLLNNILYVDINNDSKKDYLMSFSNSEPLERIYTSCHKNWEKIFPKASKRKPENLLLFLSNHKNSFVKIPIDTNKLSSQEVINTIDLNDDGVLDFYTKINTEQVQNCKSTKESFLASQAFLKNYNLAKTLDPEIYKKTENSILDFYTYKKSFDYNKNQRHTKCPTYKFFIVSKDLKIEEVYPDKEISYFPALSYSLTLDMNNDQKEDLIFILQSKKTPEIKIFLQENIIENKKRIKVSSYKNKTKQEI